MKRKIQFIDLIAPDTEARYLKLKLDKILTEFPQVTGCQVKVSKKDNIFKARVSAKYNKVDITAKCATPILSICLNNLMSMFEVKLITRSYRYGLNGPISMHKSSVFKYIKNNDHF